MILLNEINTISMITSALFASLSKVKIWTLATAPLTWWCFERPWLQDSIPTRNVDLDPPLCDSQSNL